MAVSYAARLKKGVHYGICGTPEHFDDAEEVEEKVNHLAMMIKKSKHVIVHTGAGKLNFILNLKIIKVSQRVVAFQISEDQMEYGRKRKKESCKWKQRKEMKRLGTKLFHH